MYVFSSSVQKVEPLVSMSKLGTIFGFKDCINVWLVCLRSLHKIHSKKKCSAVSKSAPQLQRAFGIILTWNRSAFRLLHLCRKPVTNILIYLSPNKRKSLLSVRVPLILLLNCERDGLFPISGIRSFHGFKKDGKNEHWNEHDLVNGTTIISLMGAHYVFFFVCFFFLFAIVYVISSIQCDHLALKRCGASLLFLFDIRSSIYKWAYVGHFIHQRVFVGYIFIIRYTLLGTGFDDKDYQITLVDI